MGRVETPIINVHKAKVLDFDFSPFLDFLIASAGDDGLVKITVFPEEGVTSEISEAAATLEGNSLLCLLGVLMSDNGLCVQATRRSAHLSISTPQPTTFWHLHLRTVL